MAVLVRAFERRLSDMIGQTVSHYRIVEKLGEGGMGVVYKAQDTQLNRLVALKALPLGTASDPERRARLIQEAQAASALNHPNIVTIHDVLRHEEGDFIVMELVPGKTLDELIPRTGMRLGEALKHAVQVASALEAAHEAGIVHRDLKPGNIMVGDDGRVRVLDFGLAKLAAPLDPTPDDGMASRATEAAPQTRDGQILGTVSYMSPEQAEGRAVDARSDIFSFGCVLYEMVSGHRPFEGASRVSTLAAVIKEDPGPLPADVPHDLDKLIGRCLRKDPQRRMRHMADVRLALEDLKEESDSGTLTGQASVPPAPSRRAHGWAVSLVSLAVLLALAASVWLSRTSSPDRRRESPRETPFTSDPGGEMMGCFSPDGSTVVFMRYSTGKGSFISTLEAKVIGAEGTQVLRKTRVGWPAFSPDGRWIAVYEYEQWWAARARLVVMPRIGGEERFVAEVGLPTHPDRSASWTTDGEWLVSPDREGPEGPFHLALISVATGEKRRLTNPPPDVFGDTGPALSPDGRTLAFTRRIGEGASDLQLLPLDEDHRPAGEPRPLTRDVPNANAATWTPDGEEIVFCSRVWHAATLWSVRADGRSSPRPLGFGGRGAYFPDIDPTGTTLLYTKHLWDLNVWRVALLSSGGAAGEPTPLLQSTLIDDAAAFSPTGEWIAFASERSGTREIWLSDLSGARLRQLTSLDSTWGMSPVWSPDGESVAFDASHAEKRDVYVVSPKGGVPRVMASNAADDWDPHWSADGRRVLFESDRGGERQIWSVSREGGEASLAEGETLGVDDPSRVFRYFAEETKDGWMIRRRRRGGGPPETIVERAGNWAFAITSRGLYHTRKETGDADSPTHIAVLDLATRQTTRIVELAQCSGTGGSLSVSPDERNLLYTQCDQEGEDDLILVENFR